MTSAVASLTSPSPASTVTMRRGTPRRAVTAMAATASVEQTTAPSTKATAHERPITVCATTATPQVVNTTSPTASEVIGRRLARKSRHDVVTASQYSSGGRNSKKTRSGSSLTVGTAGTSAKIRPRPSPPTTSRIGYGTASRFASGISAATIASETRTKTMACIAKRPLWGVSRRSPLMLSALLSVSEPAARAPNPAAAEAASGFPCDA